jgi:hypothetical protein
MGGINTNKICPFRDVLATKIYTVTKTKNSQTYRDGNDI